MSIVCDLDGLYVILMEAEVRLNVEEILNNRSARILNYFESFYLFYTENCLDLKFCIEKMLEYEILHRKTV
jgi:hypothetical protein